ncbi:DoxX family protein [Aquabacterium sp.]|uniref:DoxX family protein n=1 Tax=Aquabacterium sp. TaxID=1872578 RepID=UPI0037840BEC
MSPPPLRALAAPAARIIGWLEALQPLALLLARGYVAQVFFLSGLTKLRDWDITLALFMEEYHVPLLPPELAAALGTAGELALPVLLVLGLGTRFAALGLLCVNAVAAISLPDITDAARQQHVFWGSLLVALLLWGPGRWSLDHAWVRRWWALPEPR